MRLFTPGSLSASGKATQPQPRKQAVRKGSAAAVWVETRGTIQVQVSAVFDLCSGPVHTRRSKLRFKFEQDKRQVRRRFARTAALKDQVAQKVGQLGLVPREPN